MSITILQLVTAQVEQGERLLGLIQAWHETAVSAAPGLQLVCVLGERDAPERLALLSEWADEASADLREEAHLRLNLAMADLLVYEPALYRMRPIQRLQQHAGSYTYAGASLTFAPEHLATTVEEVAIAEGERLSQQPGFIWTKRLRSCAGPAVVFTCTAWTSRDDFRRALEAVMEPVEDRIDLLGCKQVFFSFVPRWEPH